MAALQLLISAGMRDSQIAVDKLGQRVEEAPEILPKILPVLFHHLAYIPPTSLEVNGKVRLAHAALRGLYRATIADPQVSDRSCRTRISNNWAPIWTWLSFLISNAILESSALLDDLAFRDEIELTCAALIDKFLLIPDICRNMLGTDRFIELVTSFRLLDTQLTLDSLSCLYNIFRTLQRSANDWSCWQQRCLQVLDSRPSEAVNAFLGSIMRTATSPNEIDVGALSSNLLMIIHFTTLSPKLHLAFVRHRSAAWMACLMYRLLSAPYESSGAVIGFMKGCMSYIRSAIQSHGYRCVVEALDSGILTSILRAREYMIRDKESKLTVAGDQYLQDQCVGLLRLIGCYSAYGAVLKALKRAINKAEKDRGYLQAIRGLPILVKDAWVLMENIKTMRTDDKTNARHLERTILGLCTAARGVWSACIAPENASGRVGSRGVTEVFAKLLRLCGAKVDIQASNSPITVTTSTNTNDTVYGSADQLDGRQSALQFWEMQLDSQRQLQMLSNADPSTHVIKLDYRVIPIKVGLLTLAQCESEDQGDYPTKDWEYYRQGGHIRDFGENGLLVYAIFPHGGSRRYSLIKFFPRE
ncbi:hypothetical protein VNI00_013080 [Paramarasmius palmivorus]|uniref:Uncharacterized protein n=1 Tax=Paramarasmius palmivorus TaxID=297713 RepID=A0AAW0BZU2_9AGAR